MILSVLSTLMVIWNWYRNALPEGTSFSSCFPSRSWVVMSSTLLELCIYILIPSLLVFAQPMNRTIDDTYGDLVTQLQVTYSNNWHAGQTCGVCAVSPSQAQAYAGTWHDTTSDNPNSTTLHTATLQFNGMSY